MRPRSSPPPEDRVFLKSPCDGGWKVCDSCIFMVNLNLNKTVLSFIHIVFRSYLQSYKLAKRLKPQFSHDFTKKIFLFAEQRNVKITYLFLSFFRQNCDVVQNFSSHEFPESIFLASFLHPTTNTISTENAEFDSGETGRRLGDVEKDDKNASKPVARHFNLPNHSKQSSKQHMVVCGLSLHQGSTESRKTLEQKFIFQISTLIPHGINERFSWN